MAIARGLLRLCLALLALGSVGCGAMAPQPPIPGVEEPGHSLALTIRTAYQVQATSHRWVAADIYQYDVSLRVWEGSTYVNLGPSATVVVPQKGTGARSRAVFTNLKQGATYQATVLARGNAGGTAPDLRLNADAPSQVEFSFMASQDVADMLSRDVTVTLDAVPFSGNLTLQPANPPAGTDAYEARLEDADTGAVFYTGTYAATETMVLRNVRVGQNYRVRLDALANGVSQQQATSGTIFFDPLGQDLEQDMAVLMAF